MLALLRSDELYSVDLVRRLAETSNQAVSEGTLYPLLSRLRREGKVRTSWRESSSGPPRRYYVLTDEGAEALTAFTTEWRAFTSAINALLDPQAAPRVQGPSQTPGQVEIDAPAHPTTTPTTPSTGAST